MQFNRNLGLFLAASMLCFVLGHPSPSKDDLPIRSVKSSSGRFAFESESESESAKSAKSSSVTEIEQDGNDLTARYSDYEATSASESSHLSSNSESEFVAIDTGSDGDMLTAKSKKRSASNLSKSASKSENSKFEFEQEVNQEGQDSLHDDLDLEMSYSSTSEKSETSSSSYMSDSEISINDETGKAVQKSSSLVTEENEFESEKVIEESETIGLKNVSSTKKPTQVSKTIPKNEKPSMILPKTTVPTEDKKPLKTNKNSSVQSKKIEEATSASESEMKTSSDMTTRTVAVDELVPEVKTNNSFGYKNSGLGPSQTEKPISSTPNDLQQEEITHAAEEVKNISTSQKLVENESILVNNNQTPSLQIEKSVKEEMAAETKDSLQEITATTATTVGQAPCTSGLPTPTVSGKSPELIQPLNEIPKPTQTCTSQVPNLENIPTVSPSTQLQPQIPSLNAETVSTAQSTVQATSNSEKSEKQLTETIAQYNNGPGMYSPYHQPEYGSPYSPYPMYSFEQSPFLAPLDKFPHGQPEYSPHFPQSPNMNYFNLPCNLYPFGYVSIPYPFFGFPHCGCNPLFPAPGYPNNVPGQQPDRCSGYPYTSTLPGPHSLPTAPNTIENGVTDSLLPNPIPDTATCTSGLPLESLSSDVVTDMNQRGIDVGVKTTPSVTSPLIEVPPVVSTAPQKPLSPSQEIMINHNLPSYIIDDLEARFEQAKTAILEKYTVYPEDKTEFIATAEEQTLSYDYIVLGTHVSGLSALKTLTETGKRVLILDDARLPPCETRSPYHRLGLIDSSYVTSYPAIAPKTEKKIYVSKVVGGTLSYDLGVWDHGSQQKYLQWSQTCSSWTWETTATYFRDLENVEDVGYLNGPINISYNEPECPLAGYIVKSFEEIGIQEIRYEIDSSRSESGVVLLPSMYDSQTGMNFAEKMFAEVKGRENLHMALGLQAVKIVFESERAVGVEVVTTCGNTRVIRVSEEVIVSYGVVNTVKLLQQSGFGDAGLLQRYQIPVMRDLPQLGSDVLLYPMYPGVFIRCTRGTLLDTTESDFSALGYAFKETTVQTSISTSFYKAFLQQQGTSELNIQVNIYTFSSKMTERLMYFMKGLFNFDQDMINFVMEEVNDHDLMFLVPQLLDVEKRAQISVSSANYTSVPIIDTHLYESDKDLLVMQKTLSLVRKISKTPVFRKIGGEMVQIPVKKCGKANFSKDFNECSIRELTVAGLHLTGGARMGVDEKVSVVDEELCLRGTQNVRVLNAAVLPDGVSADSAAISTVIGRRGADLIVKKI